MITYLPVPGTATLQLKVRLNRNVIGGIYKTVNDQFYYKPTGRDGGKLFDSLEDVKEDLE